jgi:hypothetical protein
MPQLIDDNLPKNFQTPDYLTLSSFKKGVISLIDKSRLPKDALEQADNIFLVEDGQPSLRPGVDWFGTAPTYYSTGTASQSGTTVTGSGTTFTAGMVGMTIVFSTGETALITAFTSTTAVSVATSQTVSSTTYVINAPIDGYDYFDFNGVTHLVCVAGGTVFRSTNDGTTWTACTGATLTANIPTLMNQYNSFLYLTNGTDVITRYDGSTTLTQYATLATPAAAAAAETGLATGTAFTYYYKIARVNTVGFSTASVVNTGTIASNLERTQWDATTNFVTLTMPASVSTQTRWDIYLSTDNIDYYYLSSVATDPSTPAVVTWVDDGTAIVIPSTTAPTASTAQGPLVKELVNVGSRMYGVRDTVNTHRIWFSSGSPPLGAFSTAYDGGYLDWDLGGKYTPIQVADYRNGKGDPLATVWCNSADGQGCILQITLDIFTVGDVSVTIPSAYKLPGSRGTPSAGSVVNVLNDYMFYNSQAFYNLGSRAQFLNLLSTDEASANIRPTVKQITTASEPNIASCYFDAKVYFSIGYGSSTNNNTAVYDTERKAWLPYAFTLGFKKFLRYTTTTGAQKLLALKPGDTKLSQISTSIQGDYGVAFTSTLKTGLYPTVKNRFEFQWTEEAEMEFSNPTGEIGVELIGLERGRGFSSQGSTTVTSTLSTTGWDTFLWDTTLWDDTSTAIDTFSESSIKRYFRLGRELNSVQWIITTNSLDAGYVLRTLQSWGTPTNGGKPRSWRLNRV